MKVETFINITTLRNLTLYIYDGDIRYNRMSLFDFSEREIEEIDIDGNCITIYLKELK